MGVTLKSGLYEQIINKVLRKELDAAADKIVRTVKIDAAESAVILAKYLSEVVYKALTYVECEDETKTLHERVAFVNKIVEAVTAEAVGEDFSEMAVDESAEELLAFINMRNSIYALRPDAPIPRPQTSLAESSLFTGSVNEPQMFTELKKEIVSCDNIDMLVSFIKWSGLRLIISELREFTARGGRLRVITTSYMGATDVKTVEELAALPNTEIMLSYDTTVTRLHAKAYMFARESGFTTAYIGSSNLSNAAMSSGLEWNLKVTQKDMPQTIRKIAATFDSYWNSPDFTLYRSADRAKLEKALNAEKNVGLLSFSSYGFDIEPYSYQQEILEKIAAERRIHKRMRNLIVAATGTGKTVISAFDYKRYVKENPLSPCRLLFIAHREEILTQSVCCFRGVLKDANFGQLYVGNHKPDSIEHLFMSIQSFNSVDMTSLTSEDYYDFIIVDEFHHAAAPTYQKLLQYYRPQILLGLTATPERMDGRSVLEYFDNRIAAEIRLPEAIERKLLSPFQYFGVSDEADLSELRWVRGGYDKTELSNLYSLQGVIADRRAADIIAAVNKYVTDINEVKGLGFCVSVKHAQFMADFFNKQGITSAALHGDTSDSVREEAKRDLVCGRYRFIFVVDLYNEGIDIPEINTVLFLRPTESLTVFLQQLGRGLRRCENKECLTVLDFIGHANHKYNFEDKFSALLARTDLSVRKEIKEGFVSLPKGCYIQLERKAAEYILENIKQSFNSTAGLIERLRSFADESGLPLTITNFTNYYHLDVRTIYLRENSFSRLCVRAGLTADYSEPAEMMMTKAFPRLCAINSHKWLTFITHLLEGAPVDFSTLPENEKKMLQMFYHTLLPAEAVPRSYEKIGDILDELMNSPVMLQETLALLRYNDDNIDVVGEDANLGYECPLELHCSYTKNQILIAMDHLNPASVREGVKYLPQKKTDLLWVTLNKSEKDYSPTTMYDDYSINAELFHWQSQSLTSENSATGERYINQRSTGGKVLLFVREYRKDISGTAPYTYLGPVEYLKHEGSKPMNVTWKLDYPIPAKYLKRTNKLAAG